MKLFINMLLINNFLQMKRSLDFYELPKTYKLPSCFEDRQLQSHLKSVVAFTSHQGNTTAKSLMSSKLDVTDLQWYILGVTGRGGHWDFTSKRENYQKQPCRAYSLYYN